jgi:hypothetical protein
MLTATKLKYFSKAKERSLGWKPASTQWCCLKRPWASALQIILHILPCISALALLFLAGLSLAQPQDAGQHCLCTEDPHSGSSISLASNLMTGIILQDTWVQTTCTDSLSFLPMCIGQKVIMGNPKSNGGGKAEPTHGKVLLILERIFPLFESSCCGLQPLSISQDDGLQWF